MRPLFFDPARPMNEEWNISPYLGVLPEIYILHKTGKYLEIMCFRTDVALYPP